MNREKIADIIFDRACTKAQITGNSKVQLDIGRLGFPTDVLDTVLPIIRSFHKVYEDENMIAVTAIVLSCDYSDDHTKLSLHINPDWLEIQN